jgi:hypothetical protein
MLYLRQIFSKAVYSWAELQFRQFQQTLFILAIVDAADLESHSLGRDDPDNFW